MAEGTDQIYHTLRCPKKAIADVNRNDDSLSLAKTYEDWLYPTYGGLVLEIKN